MTYRPPKLLSSSMSRSPSLTSSSISIWQLKQKKRENYFEKLHTGAVVGSTQFPLLTMRPNIIWILFQLVSRTNFVSSPSMRPKTFLNCFALELSVFETKHLRNVLGRILGPETYIHNPSFSLSLNVCLIKILIKHSSNTQILSSARNLSQSKIS